MLTQIFTGVYQTIRLWPESWASTATYSVGDIIKPSTSSTSYTSCTYLVTTAGSTDGTEPTWPTTLNSTISSGTVIFTTKDTKTYNIEAPQTASLPYVVFGHNTSIPIGDFANFDTIENSTFWVNCFSNRSVADVTEIADEVLTVLDSATLSITGYMNLKTQHEFIGNPIPNYTDNAFIAWQIPLRIRILNNKT